VFSKARLLDQYIGQMKAVSVAPVLFRLDRVTAAFDREAVKYKV
jgi:hypothetical protein